MTPNQDTQGKQVLGWPRITGLAFTHFYQHIIMASLPPILTLIQSDFGASYAQMGFLLSASRFSGGVLQLPAGMAADRWGKKLVLLTGFGLLLTSVFFAGLAPTFLLLILLQMIVGVGDSAFHPTTFAMISQGAPRATLGRSMSVHTMAGFMGTYVAMSLIARMGEAVGWRTTLMLLPIPGLILLSVLAGWFREPPRTSPGPSQTPRSNKPQSLWVGPLPIIFGASVMHGINMQGLVAFLPTFLTVVHGLSVVEAGDMASLMVVGVVSIFVGGWMADRVDRIRMVSVGALLAAVLVVILALWSPPRLLLSILLMATGLAVYFSTPGYTALISAYSSGAAQGRLYGLSFAGSAIGASLGALMVGFIADLASFQVAFLFLAGASVLRALLVMSLRRFDVWTASSQEA